MSSRSWFHCPYTWPLTLWPSVSVRTPAITSLFQVGGEREKVSGSSSVLKEVYCYTILVLISYWAKLGSRSCLGKGD